MKIAAKSDYFFSFAIQLPRSEKSGSDSITHSKNNLILVYN